MRYLNILVLVIWICAVSNAATPPSHTNLIYSDNLLNGGSSGVGTIVNNGGQFVANGWKANTTTSQLFITLPADLPVEGTMTVDVTNFNPAVQCSADKHQIINLYSQDNGSKAIFETEGSWVNIRTGTAYSLGEGLAGYKMLAAYNSRRHEDRYIQDATWNINNTYEFKIVWNASSVWTYAQGALRGELVMTGTMIERFRYIFLGKDNMYSGQAGPIYSNLRLYTTDDVVTPPNLSFTDITSSAGVSGITPEGYGHGVSFNDVDQDGWYDLFYTNAGGPSMDDVLYINQHNNTFTNGTTARNITDNGHTHGVISADFDNDGDLDVFMTNQPTGTNPPGRNRMYRNDGNGNFTDITDWAGISTETFFSRGGVAADINNDGWLDLFVLNWGDPNALYLNTGNGQMQKVDRGTNGPVNDEEGRQGVTAADVDNDGDIDFYVCRREVNNWLFINDGSGNFSEQASARGVAVGGRSHGAVFVDIDTDGDLDLFVMNYSLAGSSVLPILSVFYNNGSGYFSNQSSSYNIYVSGYSIVFGDVDNDADPDMYLIRNDEKEEGTRPKMYLNNGSGGLSLMSGGDQEAPANGARGAGYADIDNDGDIDFFIACTWGDNFLIRNDLSGEYHYLDVLCTGPGGDYGGFGTKVAVYEPGHIGEANYLMGYQESVSNYAYMCQNQTALHFGLGTKTTCDIRVTLTNGDVLDYTGVAADQTVEVGAAVNLGQATITGGDIYQTYGLTLTWTAVDQATGYNVYRGTNPAFQPDFVGGSNRVGSNVTDQEGGIGGIQWHDTDTVVGDGDLNYYYIITPVKGGSEGDASDVFGEFDYELITTVTTNFNQVAMPLSSGSISSANDLLNAIPYCDAVAKWNSATQGYDQYIPGLSITNFDVLDGYPYYVSVTQASVFTQTGPLADPVFFLTTTASTNFNDVMIPLDKSTLTTAQGLLNDIPYCDSVAKWNSESQGYDQYIPGIEITNFSTKVGYAYYVNVTSNGGWPSGSGSGLNKAANNTPPALASSAPHMIWGELPDDFDQSVRVRANINGAVLSDQSPGSGIKDGYWYIQLGGMNSQWKAGDKAEISILKGHTEIATSQVELTWKVADQVENLELTGKTVHNFKLFGNYPNPFNPETTIRYELPDNGIAKLVITDINGKSVKTLVQGMQQTGMQSVIWDGTNDFGYQVASGVYFYTLQYQNNNITRKLLLIR